MKVIKFIIDKHDEAASAQALNDNLKVLYEAGYSALCLESPWEDAKIEEVKALTCDAIEMIECFPTGKVPPEKQRNKKQQAIIDSVAKDGTKISQIEKVATCEKQFIKQKKIMVDILTKLESSKIDLYNIDVRQPTQHSILNRNNVMFDKIQAASQKHNKIIVFVGFAHVFNTWEKGVYARGLYQLFNDINFSITLYYPTKIPEMMSRILKYNPTQASLMISSLIKDTSLQAQTHNAHGLFKASIKTPQSDYFLFSIRQGEYDRYNQQFIEDLGGKIHDGYEQQGSFTFLKFSIATNCLTKEIRNKLLLDRLVISEVTGEGIAYLHQNVSGLTLEAHKFKDGKPGLFLTFFDDGAIKSKQPNYQSNREIISCCAKQYFIKDQTNRSVVKP